MVVVAAVAAFLSPLWVVKMRREQGGSGAGGAGSRAGAGREGLGAGREQGGSRVGGMKGIFPLLQFLMTAGRSPCPAAPQPAPWEDISRYTCTHTIFKPYEIRG